MNSYLAYGDISGLINNHEYTFITAFGELFGMMIFILFLIGSISNFTLMKSKAYCKHPFGWIVIGIVIGLMIALFSSFGIQYGLIEACVQNGAITLKDVTPLIQLNLNPALVISKIIVGSNYSYVTSYIPIANGIIYILFEFIGCFIGAFLAFLFYKRLMDNENMKTIQNCFFTSPQINKWYANWFNEFIATFFLVVAIIGLNMIEGDMAIQIMFIVVIVSGIGYGLGGVTGYALNPWRDFGPRIVYMILFHHQDYLWKEHLKYSAIPLSAPIIGSLLATIIMPGFLY